MAWNATGRNAVTRSVHITPAAGCRHQGAQALDRAFAQVRQFGTVAFKLGCDFVGIDTAVNQRDLTVR